MRNCNIQPPALARSGDMTYILALGSDWRRPGGGSGLARPAQQQSVVAVCGHCSSTGASGAPSSGEPVVMTLDFGETLPLQRVEILWEFVAKSFAISTSSDGLSWAEVYATDLNGLKKTAVNLGHQSARKLRLIMREVHSGLFQSI